ncbi:hypothetical protein [Cellulosimicrobium sp. E-16]|uniref:hypothetical protein n=1 Tax=Cellulosimicrobium sp. E-16 TaxID=3404049 RepID=UPI003CED2DD7
MDKDKDKDMGRIAATKQWLRGRGHTPARLLDVGRQLPRTERVLREVLDILS